MKYRFWPTSKKGERTGLWTRSGRPIHFGERIRFFPQIGREAGWGECTWDGTVVFEDGVPTVSTLDAEQVKNPVGWNLPHDWVRSRFWAVQVGYGEFGNWNCPRKPLTEIHNGWHPDAKDDYLALCRRHGHDKRYLNCEIIATLPQIHSGLVEKEKENQNE